MTIEGRVNRLKRTLMAGTSVLAMAATVPISATAQTVWNGSGGDYGTATNWTPNDVPDAGGEVGLLDDRGATAPTVDLGGSTYAPDTFQIQGSTGYTIQNGTLNAAIDSTSSADSTILANVNGNVRHTGTGTVTLSGDNTISDLFIQSGTVVGTSAAALGSGAGSVQIGNGGAPSTLDLGGLAITKSQLIIANGSTLRNGVFETASFAQFGRSTLDAVLAGGGEYRVLAGTNFFNAANTYTGATKINGGSLVAANNSALGSTAAGTIVADGASLRLTGGIAIGAEALSLSGIGVGGTGALRNLSGDSTYGGAITLAGDASVHAYAGTLTLSNTLDNGGFGLTFGGTGAIVAGGIVSGAGGLTMSGGGTATLSGDNTYTGDTIISSGTLRLGADERIADTSDLVVTGGAFDLANRTETIGTLSGTGGTIATGGTSGRLIVNQTVDGTYGGGFSGAVNSQYLVKQGPATLTLSGNNTLAGNGEVRVNAGTLNVAGGDAIGNTDYVRLSSGTTFGLLNAETIGGLVGGSGGNVSLGTNTLTLEGRNFTSGSGGWFYFGNISGTGGLVVDVSATGTQGIRSPLSYTGATTVKSGTLNIFGGGALVSTDIRVEGGRLRSGGGTLVSDSIVTMTGGVFDLDGDETIGALSGSGGTFDVANDRTLTSGGLDTSTTYAGVIAGDGSLSKVGTGTLTLTGSNSYSGATTVSNGVLQIGNGGTTGALGNNSNAALTGGELRFDRADIYSYSGTLSGNGTIRQQGAGTLQLTGISSGFSGTTAVDGGTLQVNGALGGVLNVGTNGTAGRLEGSGTVSSAGLTTTIGADGTLAAGTSPGTMNVAGDLVLTAGSISEFELGTPGVINGTDPATGNDLVNVGGNLSVAGTLVVGMPDALGTPAVSGIYNLFDVAGTTTGTFSTVINGGVDATATTQQIVTNGGALPSEFNIVLSNGGQLVQFWDGAKTSNQPGDTTPDGGDGVWDSDTANWTTSNGRINASWQSQVGVFGGAAGAVTVAGTQDVEGLQFITDGYTLTGGALNLTGNDAPGGNAGASFFNVDAGVTATVGTVIGGAAGIGLDKLGTGTLVLSGDNIYTGQTTIAAGMLQVGTFGDFGGSLGSGEVVNNGRLVFAGSPFEPVANAISGTGTVEVIALGTTTFTGANSYSGATIIGDGRFLNIGDGGTTGTLGTGAVVNEGILAFRRSDTLVVGNAISGQGIISQDGTGTTILTGANSYTGSTDVFNGTLQVGDGGTTGSIGTGQVLLFESSGTLAFNRSDDITVANSIFGGDGTLIQAGTGVLTFAGDGSGFSGMTWVADGTMLVTGTLGSAVGVASGATLGGTGTIGGLASVADGGTIAAGTSPGTLTVGALTLSGGSILDYELGTPTAAPGSNNDRIVVAGDVVLDGILNVTDIGGFGPGSYRLIDYGGTLTDNGLEIDTTPAGVTAADLFVQTRVASQINLISSAGADLTFWDGGNGALHDDGSIDGGDGVWNATNGNWTQADGAINGRYQPNPSFAVFQGAGSTGGTVTVDNAAEPISVTGMQFASDGYLVTGDTIALAGTDPIIRVGDGTAAGVGITATIASSLTGTGGLTKTDLGTLTLTGTNTYTGDTTVSDGTLVGDTNALRGNLANAGTVVFDQDTDAGFTGTIVGFGGVDGAMVKRGGGALFLAAASTLDWSVEAGDLVASAERFSGDVSLGATGRFTLDAGTDETYASIVSGAGAFAKTGGGTLSLTGDSSAFVGTTQVQSGMLVVNGALGGALNIATGARLAGSGRIGSLAASGTVAPGNSIGTLNIGGDLTFAAEAVYEVEVDPGGTSSDLIAAGGTATLGGTVRHIGLAGDYGPTSTYTILTAGTGLSGRFDAVSSDLVFFNPTLSYGANNVTLTLERNDISFADISLTANQTSTATAAEGLGFGNPVYDALVQLDAASARDALVRLSGDGYASTTTALIDQSRFIRGAINERLRAGLGVTGEAAPAEAVSGSGRAAWSRILAARGTMEGNGNAAGLDHSSGGLLVGMDGLYTDRIRLGFTAGYTSSAFNVVERDFDAEVDSYHLGIYASTYRSGFALRGGAAFSWHDIHTTRSASFAGFANALEADHSAYTAQTFGEVGYGFTAGTVAFEPFAGIAHVNLGSNAFTETGGPAALATSADSNGVTFTTVGLRVAKQVDLSGRSISLHGTAGWQHAFGDLAPSATNAFAGSATFDVAGVPVAEDVAFVEAGLDFDITPDATLGLSYNGQFAKDARNHGARLDLKIQF